MYHHPSPASYLTLPCCPRATDKKLLHFRTRNARNGGHRHSPWFSETRSTCPCRVTILATHDRMSGRRRGTRADASHYQGREWLLKNLHICGVRPNWRPLLSCLQIISCLFRCNVAGARLLAKPANAAVSNFSELRYTSGDGRIEGSLITCNRIAAVH
jgi:hypothetical protein